MIHQKAYQKIKKVADDIKAIKIQGATNITKETVKAIIKYGKEINSKTSSQQQNIQQGKDCITEKSKRMEEFVAKCGCNCSTCPSYKDNLKTNEDRKRLC